MNVWSTNANGKDMPEAREFEQRKEALFNQHRIGAISTRQLVEDVFWVGYDYGVEFAEEQSPESVEDVDQVLAWVPNSIRQMNGVVGEPQ